MSGRNPQANTEDNTDELGVNVFQRTNDDEIVASSLEDEAFLEIMDRNVSMNDTNGWVAPLPFRNPRRHLPNNRKQAAKRLSSLSHTLEIKPNMKKQ